MIKITNFYSEEEIERYYQFLIARKPKKKSGDTLISDRKINEVGNEIVEFLKKLPRNNTEEISDFKELITMSFSKLKNFKNSLRTEDSSYKQLCNDESNRELLNLYKSYYTRFFTSDDGKIKIKNNISLIKDLGITVCPYCNRNYINSRHDKLGCEFDHYYNKDNFPFFALTLSNLIPSCSTCNRIKGNNEYNFCPFELDPEKRENVKFIVSPPSPNSSLALFFDGISQSDNLLQLETAYEIHEKDVSEMFIREEIYCKQYRRDLINRLNTNGIVGEEFSEEFFDHMIFGEIANDGFDGYLNHSLSKLKKDTYDYIVELRRIED